MLDVDTFLTALYAITDDFYKSRSRKDRPPGPEASLSPSEVVTLAIFARFSRFASERDFYRYAHTQLRGAFPTLPDRSQFNRSVRSHVGLIEEVALHLAEVLVGIDGCPYEALDSAAMPVRDAKSRGPGWLAGYADIGWSNWLGWYEGFRLLVAVSTTGVITGFGFGAASTADQPMAETFFAAREHPSPRLASVGPTTSGCYVADKGFEGSENHRRWLERYGALLVHTPQTQQPQAKLAQATQTMGGRPPPDRGKRLRQALEYLRPSPGAALSTEWFARSFGGEGSIAQLLYPAQRPAWTPPVGFR